jgi:hypothetical protein
MESNSPISSPVVTSVEAARYIGLAPATLRNLRSQSEGPAYVRVGHGRGRVMYRLSALDSYLDARTVKPAR